MKLKHRFIPAILIVLALLVVFAFQVYAQGTEPPASPPPVDSVAFGVALVAITAFIKARFPQLGGYPLMAVALLVGAVVWFEPQVTAVYPLFGQIFAFLKAAFTAMGSVDFIRSTGQTIAASAKTGEKGSAVTS
jgi:hypothetical protein